MTHNENIKTFDDLSHDLELQTERLEAGKANGSSYTAQSFSHKPSRLKSKNNQGGKYKYPGPAPKKANATKRKRGKHGDKKGKTSTSYFNCGKKGHFTRDCTELKKALPHLSSCYIFVTGHVIVAHPHSD